MGTKSNVQHDYHPVNALQYVHDVLDHCYVETPCHYPAAISSLIEINFHLKCFYQPCFLQ